MYEALFYIALISGFFPVIILATRRRFKHPLVAFVLLTAIASFYELFFSTFLAINTSYWFQIYSLFELLCVWLYFNRLNKYRYFNSIAFILLVVIYCISFFYWNLNNALTANAINKLSLMLYVILSFLLWTKTLFKERKVENLWQHPDFYFVAALTFYYFSTAFLFLMSSFLFVNREYFISFWLLNIIATLILRISMSIGIWKMK